MRNGKRNEKAASEDPNSKANVLIQTRPRAHLHNSFASEDKRVYRFQL